MSGFLAVLVATLPLTASAQPANGTAPADSPHSSILLRTVGDPAAAAQPDGEDTLRTEDGQRPEKQGPLLILPHGGTQPELGEAATEQSQSHQPPQAEAKPRQIPPEETDAAKKEAAEDGQSGVSSDVSPPAAAADGQPPALGPLGEEMILLRDQLRRSLAGLGTGQLNTRDNTAAQIMQVCRVLGCDAEIRRGDPSGEPVNAIAWLCWNYPSAGFELLQISEDRIVARLGHGLQQHPAQLLAVLALSRTPSDYPIRVEPLVRTVADLVESEMSDCQSGADLSFKLIGLAHYTEEGQHWKNRLGEDWSVQRLIAEEIDRPDDEAPEAVVRHLMGLSYAIDQRARREPIIEGEFRRAQKYILDCQDYALKLQNPDGSWHPRFFAARGAGGTTLQRLRSSGEILEWLVFSLGEDRLEDPRVVQSVRCVVKLLADRPQRRKVASMSTRDLAAVMHAASGLAIYDDRVFRPREVQDSDPDPPQRQARTRQQPDRKRA